ncbi:hypothetical protein OUZ56_018307 [Daphnia magna]|uniref:Ankyrin repeat domain-containing protein n=1 Tax=Daphnia magna TaxID=35525 RepID=A0ABQ9Z8M2_9CRUS|nr:hypothetical protein OUZ56_018307 [Daphnia magna]
MENQLKCYHNKNKPRCEKRKQAMLRAGASDIYHNSNLTDAIQLLIREGIDINAKNDDGQNALHFLCWNNSNSNLLHAIQLLIREGIDVNAKNDNGQNALHFLCENNSKSNLLDAIKLFIQLEIDVNAKNDDGWNALHFLCENNSDSNLTDAIQLFIREGIDINAKNDDGQNALHFLCENNSNSNLLDAIKLFIQLEIDVNAKNDDGWNALHFLLKFNRRNDEHDLKQMMSQSIKQSGTICLDPLLEIIKANKLPMKCTVSVDATACIQKREYHTRYNSILGGSLRLEKTGLPDPKGFVINSVSDKLKYFKQNEPAKVIFVIMAQPLADFSTPVRIVTFASNNRMTALDVKNRHDYIKECLKKAELELVANGSDGDSREIKYGGISILKYDFKNDLGVELTGKDLVNFSFSSKYGNKIRSNTICQDDLKDDDEEDEQDGQPDDDEGNETEAEQDPYDLEVLRSLQDADLRDFTNNSKDPCPSSFSFVK